MLIEHYPTQNICQSENLIHKRSLRKRQRSSSNSLANISKQSFSNDSISGELVSVRDVIQNLETGVENFDDGNLNFIGRHFEDAKRKSDHTYFASRPMSGACTITGRKAYDPEWVNQDCYFVSSNDKSESKAFFVCDGHGKSGHLISNQCKKWFPDILSYTKNDLKKALRLLHEALLLYPSLETDCSGSTCITVMIHGSNKIEVRPTKSIQNPFHVLIMKCKLFAIGRKCWRFTCHNA